MPRNRIIYNVQDLFFGLPSGEAPLVPGRHVLKRIIGVQNVNYDFQSTRVDVGVLGKSQSAARQVMEPPSISLDFSYFLNGATNEDRMGLNVANAGVPETPCLFYNYFKEDRSLDSRNIYLVTNLSDLDVHGQNPGYDSSIAGNLSSIEDENSLNYGVLVFQNSYVSNYSVDVTIGDLPKANVSMIADNAIFYASGSGISVPMLNSKNGEVYDGAAKILIPKHFRPSLSSPNELITAFRPGDITVNIQRSASVTSGPILFESDKIQSFGMEVSLDRENISYLGYKLYADRPMTLPVRSDIDIGLLASETLSGSLLSNLSEDSSFNIVVTCKRASGAIGLRYSVSGAKFESVSYSSSIGENKTADLKFSVELDFDNKDKGIFLSGQVRNF